MSLTLLFWMVFALVLLMASTGMRRSQAKHATIGLLVLLACVGLIG